MPVGPETRPSPSFRSLGDAFFDPVEDPTNMRRCLDGAALSRRRDAPICEGETAQQFLRRALPPDGFVFWPADRF